MNKKLKRGRNMKSVTIMTVDDEKEMRDLIRIFLQKEGYTVLEAVLRRTKQTAYSNNRIVIDPLVFNMDSHKTILDGHFPSTNLLYLTELYKSGLISRHV
ncbi:hypothetical protein ACFOU2_23390 [Bacillus songklensis]|uniref:Response regulatory domain-containing protein n=1 Tax=Bacillus songklensis TaxID=1069116 RepID=A0ABV8BAV7_9BACI